LSWLVVVVWEYFFAKQPVIQPNQQTQSSEKQPAKPVPEQPVAPSAKAPTRTREQAIAASPHIEIVTPQLSGSIDLKGARIDDLTLTQYREGTNPNSPPIVLFSPRGAPDAYYAEFGWVPATGSSAEKVPGEDTVWKEEGSGALRVGHPVALTYDNGQGLIFRRRISVHDQYLFSIKDEVQNKSTKPVTFYPYALISRHGTPKVLGYYILHEGPIGVMGEEGLQEPSYKQIERKLECHRRLARLHRQIHCGCLVARH
jgi:YidC/Oxa1 family membrane protein insertase